MKDAEEYKVTSIMTFVDGTQLDVTEHLKEIQIMFSLNLAIPEVALIFTKYMRKLEKNISSITIKIESYKHSGSPLHTDMYELIPIQTDNVVDAPTKNLKDTFLASGSGSTDRIVLFFYIKSVYDTVNYTVGPLLKFNTKLGDIIDSILPPNCSLDIRSDLELNKVVPQVFIRKQPFLSALNYLKNWFGFSKGPVCTTIIPYTDTEDTQKTLLILDDINISLTRSEFYDKELVLRSSTKITLDTMTEEFTNKKFVVDLPVKFYTNIVSPAKYVFIVKPYRKLYKSLELTEVEIINEFGAANKGYYPDIENNLGYTSVEKRIINNHTGFDESFSPLTSMFAFEYMFSCRGLLQLDSIPSFRFLWPTDHVKLTIDDPENALHGGIYVTESTLYRLTREKSREWQLGVEISIVRSNTYYQQQPYKVSKSGGSMRTQQFNIGNVQNDIVNVNQKIDDVSQDIDNCEEKIQSLEEDTAYMDYFRTSLSDNLNNINTDLDNVKENIQDLQTCDTIDEFENLLIDTRGRIDSIFDVLDETISTINGFETRMESLKSSYSSLLSDLENIHLKMDIDIPTLKQSAKIMENYAENNVISFIKNSVTESISRITDKVLNESVIYNVDYIDSILNSAYIVNEKITQEAWKLKQNMQFIYDGMDEILSKIETGSIGLDYLKSFAMNLDIGENLKINIELVGLENSMDIIKNLIDTLKNNLLEIKNTITSLQNVVVNRFSSLMKNII